MPSSHLRLSARAHSYQSFTGILADSTSSRILKPKSGPIRPRKPPNSFKTLEEPGISRGARELMLPIAESNLPLCVCSYPPPPNAFYITIAFRRRKGAHTGANRLQLLDQTEGRDLHPQGHLMFSNFRDGLSFGFFRRPLRRQQPSPFVS